MANALQRRELRRTTPDAIAQVNYSVTKATRLKQSEIPS